MPLNKQATQELQQMQQSQSTPKSKSITSLEKDAMKAGEAAMKKLLKKYENQAKREKK